MDFCFRHKWMLIVATLLMVPMCIVLFILMPQQRMPDIASNETLMSIDWNENISIDENRRRILDLSDSASIMTSAYVGPQDYLLNSDIDLSSSEAEVYFMTESTSDIEPLQNRMAERMSREYPSATLTFSKTENIFEKIFSSTEANIEARIHHLTKDSSSAQDMMTLKDELQSATEVSLIHNTEPTRPY